MARLDRESLTVVKKQSDPLPSTFEESSCKVKKSTVKEQVGRSNDQEAALSTRLSVSSRETK
jgi:hypothetical protein